MHFTKLGKMPCFIFEHTMTLTFIQKTCVLSLRESVVLSAILDSFTAITQQIARPVAPSLEPTSDYSKGLDYPVRFQQILLSCGSVRESASTFSFKLEMKFVTMLQTGRSASARTIYRTPQKGKKWRKEKWYQYKGKVCCQLDIKRNIKIKELTIPKLKKKKICRCKE